MCLCACVMSGWGSEDGGQRGNGSQGLCIDLCGGGLLVDGLLPQVIASLVLLLHAVDEQQDEENSKHQADGSAHDQSCKRQEG